MVDTNLKDLWLHKGQVIGFLLLVTIFASSKAGARIIRVGAEGDFHTVSEALRSYQSSDSIIILSGNYTESNLVVRKPVTIIGDGWPVIDGSNGGSVLTVSSSNVYISGLEIRNTQASFVDDNAAILLDGVNGCAVVGNRFRDNFFGVYLAKSFNCRVIGNDIIGSAKSESRAGNGVHLWYCRDIEVEGNQIKGHRDGIYFEFVKGSQISRNLSEGNLRYGLHFMFSDSCTYRQNEFVRNGAGVAVMYTRWVTMENNEFTHNWGTSSYGLLLKEISDSRVENNRFFRNSVGIYIEGCNRITVRENDLIENGWALKLMSNSVDNVFHSNNFIGNSFQVGASGRQNFSVFDKNYWSDYSGYDLDRDGFGDVPFRPVSLFSIVVEKHPPTLVLVHSLIMKVVNLAERMFPSLTPETLVDAEPLMEPRL